MLLALLFVSMLLRLAAFAQSPAVTSKDVSVVGGFAPLVALSPSTVGKSEAALPGAQPSLPSEVNITNYFVPGLRVELPGLGVSSTLRDMALAQAAKEGLVRLIGSAEPPLEPALQARMISATTTPLSAVHEYRIAEEILTPSYTLVVDITYEPGRVRELLEQAAEVQVGAAVEISGVTEVTAAPAGPQQLVRVSGNAGAQDKVLQALQALGLNPGYTRLALGEAEIGVHNAVADTLAAHLRAKGMVVELGSDGAVEVRF